VIAATRSELTRLNRKGMLAGWFGLTAVFAVIINVVMFSFAADSGDLPTQGPGVAFPDVATLETGSGLVAGVSTAASMFGVVTLSFWAIATATDYSSGLIRLTASAQPRRWKLLAGKVVALMLLTAAATTLALVINVGVAPVAAEGAGFDVTAWRDNPATEMTSTWVTVYASLLVWGVIGLAIALVTRSAAVAISIGAGWVLLVEGIVAAAFDSGLDWLPGVVLTAVAQGGNDTLSFASAAWLAAGYVIIGLGAALAVTTRRDITD
jgi:ABC-type transport system involved in multi-copper enzyme maturation permease subunit